MNLSNNPVNLSSSTGADAVGSSPSSASHRKRGAAIPSPTDSTSDVAENRRKLHKVSRACDLCKAKKAKCTGTRPCDYCVRKRLPCEYDAKYSRGRPPTPPPPPVGVRNEEEDARTPSRGTIVDRSTTLQGGSVGTLSTDCPPSRASPELEAAEIEGQYFDQTSGLTFLHRAWRRLSTQNRSISLDVSTGVEQRQRLMTAGDRPFDPGSKNSFILPDRATTTELLSFYFDVCVVTYRFLHRQVVEAWHETLRENAQRHFLISQGIGNARTAIVLNILAIASVRREKLRGAQNIEPLSTQRSDQFFCAAAEFTEAETGFPTLESAQARLLQVLYLLQTSRMNQGWYIFGNTSRIIAALGLHRSANRKRHTKSISNHFDYIYAQCGKRAFWTAYTMDMYLSVVFGRPRQYHDEDIDQDFPDSINDEDMTSNGPSSIEAQNDSYMDGLIFHAKLAQIIGNISREVYSIKRMPRRERLAAAHRYGKELHQWRSSLPPFLGTVRPSSLIPSFRRQSTALKLAYCHAIMHANRTFLPGSVGSQAEAVAVKDSVAECISAARTVLETVNGMANDGSLFHAFWWTHYVTFCALAVAYVWDIQRNMRGNQDAIEDQSRIVLSKLAESCHGHLAKATAADSPSQRYTVILEELMMEAKNQSTRISSDNQYQPLEFRRTVTHNLQEQTLPQDQSFPNLSGSEFGQGVPDQSENGLYEMQNALNEWDTTDWLDLDASAFSLYSDFTGLLDI